MLLSPLMVVKWPSEQPQILADLGYHDYPKNNNITIENLLIPFSYKLYYLLLYIANAYDSRYLSSQIEILWHYS